MITNELLSIVYGLLSSASWGAGDFSGGYASRRTNVYVVIVLSQMIGVLLLIGCAVALGERIPPGADLIGGAVFGAVGCVGLLSLYRALSISRMSVVAPVSAVITALVPVLWGFLTEGMPGSTTLFGFALALVAVWIISRPDNTRIQIVELSLPIVAGLSFGVTLILIDRITGVAVFVPLVAARFTSISILLVAIVALRQPRKPAPSSALPIVAAGVFDAGGNAFYALAAGTGRLDVAAVLSSLYPAITVLLAWVVLRERITRLQLVGVLIALLAIGLISLRS